MCLNGAAKKLHFRCSTKCLECSFIATPPQVRSEGFLKAQGRSTLQMAFCKAGSLLKAGISQNGQVPMASMFNATRYVSSKLFVGGLSFSTDDVSLKEAFECCGEVSDVKVIMDRNTGRSRGFGFVSFASEESAIAAIASMDGRELHGRNIRVSVANERPPQPSFSGGGGGGGGGEW